LYDNIAVNDFNGAAEPERMYSGVKGFHEAPGKLVSNMCIMNLPVRHMNGKHGEDHLDNLPG